MILYSINARIRHTDASDGIKHSCYKAFGFPNENIKLQIFFQQNIPIFAALSLRVSVCVCVCIWFPAHCANIIETHGIFSIFSV